MNTPNNPIATALVSSGTLLTVGAIADGQAVVRSGTSLVGATASGVGGSTGSTDNAILRADGTGGATVQSSAVTVDDSGNLSTAGTVTASNVGASAGYAVTALAKPTSGATSAVAVGSSYDLCGLGNTANLLTTPDTETTWVSTNLTSAARSGGVITVVHSTTTDASNARETGTQPHVRFNNVPTAGRLVVKMAVGTNGNYYIGQAFARNPGGGNAYYGIQVYNGTVEAWQGSARKSVSITTTNANWYMYMWAGNTGRTYYSTSASEPTEIGSTASSQWVFMDQFTLSDPSAASVPQVGAGFWHFTGSASVTYTISTLRMDAL